jgi:hypothetical protein
VFSKSLSIAAQFSSVNPPTGIIFAVDENGKDAMFSILSFSVMRMMWSFACAPVTNTFMVSPRL